MAHHISRVLHVGERGIGRSTLLAGVRNRATRAGLRVRYAAGAASERDVPYALIDQLGAAHADLLIVDDLQWADRASLEVLATLLHGPVGLVATAHRPSAALPLRIAEVPPVADPARLLRQRHPDLAPPVVARLVAEARGNPLALLELAAGLDAAQRSARRPLPDVLPLGERGRAVFAGAVAAVPARTRALLLEAALAGDDGYLEALRAQGDLEPAVRAGLVTTGPARFAHPLAAPTVAALATAAERRTAHHALSRSPLIGGLRADLHLAACTTSADAALADRLETAAHQAWSRGDGLHAAPILVRAAELSDPEPAVARRLGLAAQVHAELTGQADQAAELGRRAGAGVPPASLASLGSATNPLRVVRSAGAALRTDRLGDHRPALRGVVRGGAGGGAVRPAVEAQALLALDDFGRGRWAVAALRAGQARRLARTYGAVADLDPVRYVEALLAAARGAGDTARARIDELLISGSALGSPEILHRARHAAALAGLGRADYEAAYRQARAITAPGALAGGDLCALWTAPILIEAAMRTDRTDAARKHAAALTRIAPPGPRFAMSVAAGRAMVASADEALVIMDRAAAVPGLGRWPFDLARLNLRFGEALRRAREIARSRAHLRLALHDFERLGAVPWVARASAELAAAGLGRAEPVGEGTLTAQEREIVELAATGLTNKQIAGRLLISPRTVGAHLHRSFDKLGVASRAALRDALARVGP